MIKIQIIKESGSYGKGGQYSRQILLKCIEVVLKKQKCTMFPGRSTQLQKGHFSPK